jgi:hypothetical protein
MAAAANSPIIIHELMYDYPTKHPVLKRSCTSTSCICSDDPEECKWAIRNMIELGKTYSGYLHAYAIIDEPECEDGWAGASNILATTLRDNGHKFKDGEIRKDGYVSLDALKKVLDPFTLSYAQIYLIVMDNKDNMFSLMDRDGITYIRANFGHSTVFEHIVDPNKLSIITLPF